MMNRIVEFSAFCALAFKSVLVEGSKWRSWFVGSCVQHCSISTAFGGVAVSLPVAAKISIGWAWERGAVSGVARASFVAGVADSPDFETDYGADFGVDFGVDFYLTV